MGGNAVELLADIGLGGDHDRFLIEAIRVEAIGGLQQGCNLFGQSRPDRFRLAAGRGLGLLRQLLDLVHALVENLPERDALAAPHLDQIGQRLLESHGRGFFGRLVLGLVAFGFDDLDDALDAEQAVDAGRHRVDPAGEMARHLDDRVEHILIDADGRDRVGALDVQIGVHRAARQHLAGALLGEGLQFIPTGRQPQAQIEAFGVDRFQFPFERIGTAGAVAPGKTGHAR